MLTETLIVARHPSETQEHVILRVLAWCLLHEEGLAMRPRPVDARRRRPVDPRRHRPADDAGSSAAPPPPSGCASRCSTTRARAATSSSTIRAPPTRSRAELAEARWPRGCPPPTLWTIDRALVAALAADEERRARWSVTIVGDHFYIDVDGRTLNGAVTAYTSAA